MCSAGCARETQLPVKHIVLVANELWKRLEIMERTETTSSQIGEILLKLKTLEERVRYLERYIEVNEAVIPRSWMNVPIGSIIKEQW